MQDNCTNRSHHTRQAPLSAQQPVAVKTAVFIQVSVQDVHSYHTGVHGIGVLSHRCFDHCLPGIAGKSRITRQFMFMLHI